MVLVPRGKGNEREDAIGHVTVGHLDPDDATAGLPGYECALSLQEAGEPASVSPGERR